MLDSSIWGNAGCSMKQVWELRMRGRLIIRRLRDKSVRTEKLIKLIFTALCKEWIGTAMVLFTIYELSILVGNYLSQA